VRTRKRCLLLGGVVGAFFAVTAIANSEEGPTVSGLESRMWSPMEVTVAAGGAVTFQDTSTSVPHGVVWEGSDPNTPSCSGVPVDRGETNWRGSCSFTKAGTFRYYCYVHGMAMSGTVNVTPSLAPTIKKLSPRRGTAAGGTPVTITGTNLTGATAVKFGATNAKSFTVNSATSITAESSEEPPGSVEVTVTTPGGTSAPTHKDHFKFKKLKR
jgi:plastocyanin